jgi:hypothetical protein
LELPLTSLDSIELVWDNTSTNFLNEVLVWEKQGQNQSMDWSGGALPVRVISEDMIAGLDASASATSLNGNGITGLSLKAIRYTTSTGISATIESKTLSLLAHLSINASTEDAIRTGRGFGLSLAESVAFINLLKLITTKGVTAYPRGAKRAPSKTPESTTARDALLSARSANFHSTVKPASLMRYLCRLITPPGGVILDPFTGSGSTGKAAMLEGFSFVGIEQDADYADIARARIQNAAEQTRQLELL